MSLRKKANFVARLDQDGNTITDGDQVDVGGNEKYVSLCRRHFMQTADL